MQANTKNIYIVGFFLRYCRRFVVALLACTICCVAKFRGVSQRSRAAAHSRIAHSLSPIPAKRFSVCCERLNRSDGQTTNTAAKAYVCTDTHTHRQTNAGCCTTTHTVVASLTLRGVHSFHSARDSRVESIYPINKNQSRWFTLITYIYILPQSPGDRERVYWFVISDWINSETAQQQNQPSVRIKPAQQQQFKPQTHTLNKKQKTKRTRNFYFSSISNQPARRTIDERTKKKSKMVSSSKMVRSQYTYSINLNEYTYIF